MDHHVQGQISAMFDEDHAMSLNVDQLCAYNGQQPGQHLPHDSVPMVEQNALAYAVDLHGQWGASASQMPNYQLQDSFPPASVRSSTSSNARSSKDSIFSHLRWRGSVASTNTTWSQFSEPSREHYVAHTEELLTSKSPITYTRPPATIIEQNQCANKQRISQRQASQSRDQFATCVSRIKRSRRSTKQHRYWCTACKEGFREKYDWKRHEETYQERCETYECDLCKKTYFLEKDFVHHHRESHRCQTCAENQHIQMARRIRRGRTGWGCGFCPQFHSDWTERCSHVASHFEGGSDIDCWSQTQVIMSLIQRPGIQEAWNRILDHKQEINPSFGWSQRWAGRAEGYPDSERAPQLQDLLEFFTMDHDASSLANFAYETGHQSPRTLHQQQAQKSTTGHTHRPATHQIAPYENSRPGDYHDQTRHPSPPDKELPPEPPSPPVPAKDSQLRPAAPAPSPAPALNHNVADFVPWDRLMSTILEDEMLPDGMPMDICGLDFADLEDHFPSNLHSF